MPGGGLESNLFILTSGGRATFVRMSIARFGAIGTKGGA